ncbi:MAG: flagellar basal body P-ring formation chaperone FlgA [Methylomicrobium sp.]
MYGIVYALTEITPKNRHIDMIMKFIVILIAVVVGIQNSYATATYQAHESIYRTVTEFISDNVNASEEDYEIHVSSLDDRLKLPECAHELTAFTAHHERLKSGRFSVGVRCAGPQTWTIFVTGKLQIFENVLVLNQPVRRGQMLTRQMLSLDKRDRSKLRGGHFNDPDWVENKQATRSLPAGTVLNYSNIKDAVLIKRGEKIMISASSPEFHVRMPGQALMDGIKGQSIRVKNESSGRTIAATVIEPGLVSVTQ